MIRNYLTKKYNVRIIVLLVATMLSTLLGACRFGRKPDPTPIPITLPTQFSNNASTTSVATYTAQKGVVIQNVSYSGQIVLATQEELFFERGGHVANVYVQDGDMVQEGDIVAELDNQSLQTDLELAQSTLLLAQRDEQEAKQKLEDDRQAAQWNLQIITLRLHDAEANEKQRAEFAAANPNRGGTPTPVSSELDILRIQQQQAEMNLNRIPAEIDPSHALAVRRAEVAFERIKQSILEGQIVAPFAGQIRYVNLPNDARPTVANAYATVARLVDPKQFYIELNLTRTQMEPLREQMPVRVSASALGDQEVEGVIAGLPKPFGTSDGPAVRIALVNPMNPTGVTEGKSALVNITQQSSENSIVIPSEALQQRSQLYFVLVKDGDTQREVNVTVGLISDGLAEIIAGLHEGDAVILSSTAQISQAVAQLNRNAQLVRIAQATPRPEQPQSGTSPPETGNGLPENSVSSSQDTATNSSVFIGMSQTEENPDQTVLTATATAINNPPTNAIATQIPPPPTVISTTKNVESATQIGKILFLGDENKDSSPELYSVNADGTELVRLEDLQVYIAHEQQDSSSADKRYQVSIKRSATDGSGWQIFVNDQDTNEERQASDYKAGVTIDSAALSADASTVVFVSDQNGNREIWSLKLDEWPAKRITKNSWQTDDHPSWSPDRTQITFSSNRSRQRQIWVINADGSNPHLVLELPFEAWNPVWVKYEN